MNKYQKFAWFTLIILWLALGLSITAMLVLHFALGMSWHRSMGGFGFLGFMGFTGICPLLFKKDGKDPDERDLLINRKAIIAAYGTFWPLFVLAAMAPLFLYGPDGRISVLYLCWMVFGGMYWVLSMYSIAILNQYGWKNNT